MIYLNLLFFIWYQVLHKLGKYHSHLEVSHHPKGVENALLTKVQDT